MIMYCIILGGLGDSIPTTGGGALILAFLRHYTIRANVIGTEFLFCAVDGKTGSLLGFVCSLYLNILHGS